MTSNKHISEYDAALRFNFSPELLRWMTKNGVVDKTRLSFEIKNEIYYFDIDELNELNKKMEGQWPKTAKGQRPGIPTEIKNEIKREARFSCPVCNRNTGEVAHIDPVSATNCNHPKNLIYLCPNHHTEYDNAIIPNNIAKKDVVAFKKSLRLFQRALWKIQGETINSFLSALNETRSLLKIHDKIAGSIPDSLFKETLKKIAELSGSERKLNYTHTEDIERLDEDVNSYIEEHGENICPLCEGHGSTHYYDPCPVCNGNGDVLPEALKTIDMSMYVLVDCKLCEGRAIHMNNDCPACGADGQISQYLYDNHDWTMYDLVTCKLCKGKGSNFGIDCRPCGSEGHVSRYFNDTYEWSKHDLVTCKLCDGKGTHLGNDCPPCDGNGEVSQEFFYSYDWSGHDLIDCKLCKGSGSHLGEDCRACQGEGSVSENFYYNVDWSRYEMIECKLCRGEGRYRAEDCVPCGGEGEIFQYISDDLDWSYYRKK